MRIHICLYLIIVTILVQPSIVIGCKQPAEQPSAPSTQPTIEQTPASKLPPEVRPVPPPQPPASINPPGFLNIGDLAAANTEVANVEAAAAAYYAINGNWPSNTHKDLVDGGFISKVPIYDYNFDSSGHVLITDGTVWPEDSSIVWSASEHEWHR